MPQEFAERLMRGEVGALCGGEFRQLLSQPGSHGPELVREHRAAAESVVKA